ncbi:MAG: TPM domain-containing protein [Xanthomonadaceae bacterium]|nr:TPM domain-containing protein [Xanthomonadaceae bacterium]
MLRRYWSSLVFLVLVFSGIEAAFSSHEIPPTPKTYVYQEISLLAPETNAALERLLYEHARITTEQIIYAVFETLGDESLEDFTTKVFEAWKPGAARKNNGALVAIFWKERKIRVEVGYGLEGQLTDSKSKDVISDIMIPEMRAGKPDAALIQSALEILKIIESPLISDGRATQILAGANLTHTLHKRKSLPLGTMIFIWILIFGAIAFFARLIYEAIAQESYYSSTGWGYTRRNARNHHNGGGFFGGGFGGGSGGGFGGGGGFSGGGGMSGGGGASGNW